MTDAETLANYNYLINKQFNAYSCGAACARLNED